ncbi:MAG: HAMP domain-containing sensor histidine kinase, partial [Knoellia sp.]
IRWRVTGAFCAAFVLVMSIVGAAVLAWFAHSLTVADDRALQVRVDALVAAQAATSTALPLGGPTAGFDENPTQILDTNGRPLTSSTGLRVALLTPDQTRRAATRPLLTDRAGDADLDESLRVRAHPVDLPDGTRLVVAAASSLNETGERVASLRTIGSLGLLAALMLCAAGGYLAAGVALRPVEQLRRDAEAVDTAGRGQLSTPAADDEIARLARTLNTMLGRIRNARTFEQAALRREHRFVADASHELRAPLTNLRTEIELALADPAPTVTRLRDALDSAGQESARLSRLTDDLLTLARTHALAAQPCQVDLPTLLAAVLDEHKDAARDNGRVLTLTCTVPAPVWLDPSLIRCALTNLIGNALRYGRGPVRCTARQSTTVLTLEVRDHGPGFDPAFLPHATERFTRADPARHTHGTGLGLAIADAVAIAHHGQLSITNHDDGANVTLHLPLTVTG